MFYASLFLSKRGPLAKIWLAAHWDKKLTKAHVFECNLEATVESIISPKVKIALRTSGHLLLGVVRIYNRKAKYLLADCNEAFTKIRIAFRPDIVDLAEENLEATYNAITLPEEFHDFSIQLPDVDAIDVAEHFTLNQSTSEAITLKEDLCSILQDDGFGHGYKMLGNSSILDDNLMSTSESLLPQTPINNSSAILKEGFTLSYDRNSFQNDGFGDEGAACMLEELLSGEAEDAFVDFKDINNYSNKDIENQKLQTAQAGNSDVPGPLLQAENAIGDQTTLISNEEECFALQPVDATVFSERKRGKRRRKLIVDCIKELDSNTIRDQIEDVSDIITTIELAPPTKKLMKWKETGGVEKLNSLPAQHLINYRLLKLFRQCLRKNLHWEKINESDALERRWDIEQMRSEGHNVIDLPIIEELCVMQESINESKRSSIEHGPISVQKICKGQHSASEKEIPELEKSDSDLMQVDLPLEESLIVHLSAGEERGSEQMEFAEQKQSGGKDHDFEETRSNERTQHLWHSLQRIHLRTGERTFSILELCRNNNRKQAAAKFYSLLMLKKQLVLKLTQREPFSDIIATTGELFNL
ncbi:double-strand-break repair protein rad21 homolog isoform X1 [Leucoraja erinacea]|uniref:double-strand-break repair protein rad21 homolog isoform X1 n=1 Tax=Leucoraja erinaceus TaxID=7782 RepID=UPI002458D616|nr:double-strand-break repair protein rad21 homolog isoform X1 [Leucoraja erinacea]